MKNPELIPVERYDKEPSFLVEILLGAAMVAVWLGVFWCGANL